MMIEGLLYITIGLACVFGLAHIANRLWPVKWYLGLNKGDIFTISGTSRLDGTYSVNNVFSDSSFDIHDIPCFEKNPANPLNENEQFMTVADLRHENNIKLMGSFRSYFNDVVNSGKEKDHIP